MAALDKILKELKIDPTVWKALDKSIQTWIKSNKDLFAKMNDVERKIVYEGGKAVDTFDELVDSAAQFKSIGVEINKTMKQRNRTGKQFGGILQYNEDAAKRYDKLQASGTKRDKKKMSFMEGVQDITKDYLQNLDAIGTEEFVSLGLTRKIREAKRLNLHDEVAYLEMLKSRQDIMEVVHKRAQSAADAIAKPFEQIDSFLRSLPGGGFLADILGLDEIAKQFKEGFLEGVAEEASKQFEDIGQAATDAAQKSELSWNDFQSTMGMAPEEASKYWKEYKAGQAESTDLSEEQLKVLEEEKQEKYDSMTLTQKLASKAMEAGKSFMSASMSTKIMGAALIVAVAAAAKFAMKVVSLSKELGISMTNVAKMGPMVMFAGDEAGALVSEFGRADDISGAMLFKMKMMSYWTGASVEDQAKINMLMRTTTNLSKEAAFDEMAKWTKELKKEGLSASKVIADMASNADYFADYMGKGGNNVKEAAKEAAKMGLSLSETASMAESLLDWESSIEAEMEASVLLGRQLNLDRARQLAFEGKHVEMMEEAKRAAGGEAEFLKMNVVQRQALGAAIGLQGAALAEMVGAQDKATESAEGFRWAWVAAGTIVGLIGGMLISIIPGIIASTGVGSAAAAKMQKAGFKVLGKGALIGTGLGLAGGVALAATRAEGGPVQAGNPYVVGDGGKPELFVPSVTGNILPEVPQMADGTGFVQGDMRKLEQGIATLVGLQQERIDQADVHSRKFGRDVEGAFQQR
tara:strand:- start:124 stop:2370 length:2247 start_codon:yes stop_codon:yes gene_type:complete